MRVALLLVSVACGRSADLERCRAIGGGALSSNDVELRLGSRLTGTGELRVGEVGSCDDDASATAVFLIAVSTLSTIPAALRPDRTVIHYAPRLSEGARPLEGLEMHRPSRSLLAIGSDIDPRIWLHELAHLRMHGDRPSGPVGRGLVAAIEEGVADYYAAAVGRSPRLPARDLENPPRGTTADWSALAFDSFDPHRLGWRWAALLWRIEPASGPLLEDLVRCVSDAKLGGVADRIRTVLDAWLDGCPVRSRRVIAAQVCNWIPRELATGCP